MNAVDTNVLFYAHDPREPQKQAIAVELIETLADGVLLWQVACEYLAASKKLEPHGYSREQAWQDIRDLQLVWTTLLPDWTILERADQLLSDYSFSFWDALIVAACLEGKITRFYSEDMHPYPTLSGLEIVNPFDEAT